ncbi:hypothetical protein V500_04079 [Pseudogymnoascus sp. VKM F-4518 (FW-2643)]|nr:hypothetical protein V500_04079 [Pseudogymnoascus sp. VKM F-4518 (FW-2643)]
MRPGQYFYVELSTEESWKNYFKTAHPLMAVWHETSEPMTEFGTECSSEIKFLIKPLDGHSLIPPRDYPKVVLYGPYGKDLQLQSYENVMIVAQGIGISSVLSYVRQIVTWKSKGDIRKTVLTRKLDVFWLLDDNCEEDWLSEYLPELRKLDRKRILQFWSYYPNKQKKRGNNNAKSDKQEKKRKGVISEEQKKEEISVRYRYIDPESRYTPVPIAIKEETMNSPGKSIVVVCGSPLLTKSMRDNVRALMTRKNPIRFVEVEYRPHSDCFSKVRPEYLKNDVSSELRGVAPRQESSSGAVGLGESEFV